jgi:AbrB family looped-hinge helix DNA binding protein
VARLTSAGQVTIPIALRYELGLSPGDEIVFGVEGDRGTFRRALGLDRLSGVFPHADRPGAHPLERLLVAGDLSFVTAVAARRREGRKLRLPDAVLLDVAVTLVSQGAAPAAVAAALRDVLAERAIRVDHPAAVRIAVDALARGADALRAYALARG